MVVVIVMAMVVVMDERHQSIVMTMVMVNMGGLNGEANRLRRRESKHHTCDSKVQVQKKIAEHPHLGDCAVFRQIHSGCL